MSRPVLVATHRLTGINAGTQVLMPQTAPHVWRLDCFLLVPEEVMKKGKPVIKIARQSRIVDMDAPCYLSDLASVYDKVIGDLCDEFPVVRGGGIDIYLVPKALQCSEQANSNPSAKQTT